MRNQDKPNLEKILFWKKTDPDNLRRNVLVYEQASILERKRGNEIKEELTKHIQYK